MESKTVRNIFVDERVYPVEKILLETLYKLRILLKRGIWVLHFVLIININFVLINLH